MVGLRLPSGPSLRARPPLVRPDPQPHAKPSAPALKVCEEYSTTVAVKIKLARFGKIREPFYRIVVADARTRRSGRAIENIGLYHPKADPSVIEVDSARAQYWLSLRPQPVKADKRALYEAAMASVSSDDANTATTPRKKRTQVETSPEAAAPESADA